MIIGRQFHTLRKNASLKAVATAAVKKANSYRRQLSEAHKRHSESKLSVRHETREAAERICSQWVEAVALAEQLVRLSGLEGDAAKIND